MLAGVQHITISPPLLLALSQTEYLDESLTIFGQPYSTEHLYSEKLSYIDRESEYRLAFTRSGNGTAEGKLTQAIGIFCEIQEKMEAMFRPVIDVADNNKA